MRPLSIVFCFAALIVAVLATGCPLAPNVPGQCYPGSETQQWRCPDGRCCPTLEACCSN